MQYVDLESGRALYEYVGLIRGPKPELVVGLPAIRDFGRVVGVRDRKEIVQPLVIQGCGADERVDRAVEARDETPLGSHVHTSMRYGQVNGTDPAASASRQPAQYK